MTRFVAKQKLDMDIPKRNLLGQRKNLCMLMITILFLQVVLPVGALSETIKHLTPNFDLIVLNGESGNTFAEGLVPAKFKKKWGYISKLGQYIIAPQFEGAYSFADGLAPVLKDGKYGYINKEGNMVANGFDAANILHEGMGGFMKNGKFGFVDNTGRIAIEPKFDDIRNFSDGLACVLTLDGAELKIGFIDKTGAYAIDPSAISPAIKGMGDFQNGFAWVETNQGYGLIDKSGIFVAPAKYLNKGSFSEDLALVSWQNDDKVKMLGFIDKSGMLVIEPLGVKEMGSFREGLAYVKYSDGEIGYDYAINKNLYEIKQRKNKKKESVAAKVYSESVGESVYGNKAGSVAKPKQTSQEKPFSTYEDYKAANSGNNPTEWIAYIDRSGIPVFGLEGTYGDSFSEGLAVVCNGKKYGYVDNLGNFAIEAKYEDACAFKEGLAKVKSDGKWGFIDKKGNYVIQPTLEDDFDGNYFQNSIALSRQGKKTGYIDRSGRFYLEPIFDEAEVITEHVAKVKYNGKNAWLIDRRPQIFLNGKMLFFDVLPVNVDGRLLVPMRTIFEALQAQLTWDDSTKSVTAQKDSTSINIQMNNKQASVNDQDVALDVPARIINGRTMVPLRFITQSLGAKIGWNEDERAVNIHTDENSSQAGQ